MDMYYRLKQEFYCRDECGCPDLKFEERSGAFTYVAVCMACGQKYEIEVEMKRKD